MKIKLLGKSLDDLKNIVAEEGLPGFTAKQIARWLYVKKVRSIDEMTDFFFIIINNKVALTHREQPYVIELNYFLRSATFSSTRVS